MKHDLVTIPPATQQADVVYDLWNLETSSFLAYLFRGAAARAGAETYFSKIEGVFHDR